MGDTVTPASETVPATEPAPTAVPAPAPAVAPERPLRRWAIGFNVLVQILLYLVLFGIANYLSYRHYYRKDLTPTHDYTLSDTTLNYLHKLGKDVEISVVFSRSSPVVHDVRTMVEEFRRAKRSHVHTEEIDPARDLERAEQLKLQNKIVLKGNGILVRANDRSRFISEEEMVIKGANGDRKNPSLDFRGEDALMSTILGLLEGTVHRFYFVVGKGLATGQNVVPAYEALGNLGRQENFEVKTLNFTEIEKIPDDANGVIIIGPKYDFSDREIAMISNYWQGKRAGLLVLLDPNGETPRLRSFLESNGVVPRADRVLYAESTSTGPKKEFAVDTVFLSNSPISRPFVETASRLEGQTQSLDLRMDSPELNAQNIEIIALAMAAPRYWGETQYMQQLPVVDPEDTTPPVYLAASVERGKVSDDRLRVDSARMVVVGNATLLDPSTRLAVHEDFVAASLNWMIKRERLIGITPKHRDVTRVFVPDVLRQKIWMVTSFIMPGVVLLLGLVVWNHRRA